MNQHIEFMRQFISKTVVRTKKNSEGDGSWMNIPVLIVDVTSGFVIYKSGLKAYPSHVSQAMLDSNWKEIPMKYAGCWAPLAEPEKIGLVHPRESVRKFAELMECKLSQHDDRPHWLDQDLNFLIERLDEEFLELKKAIAGGNPNHVALEAADVGAMAMIVNEKFASIHPAVEPRRPEKETKDD